MRFIVESVMSTPSSERSPMPGAPTVEFTPEGRDFYGRVRALIEDGDGGTAGASDMSTFLSLIIEKMPLVLDASVLDGGACPPLRPSPASVAIMCVSPCRRRVRPPAPACLLSPHVHTEIEAAFQVIASFIGAVSSPAEAASVVRALAAVLTSSSTSRVALRLRMCVNVWFGVQRCAGVRGGDSMQAAAALAAIVCSCHRVPVCVGRTA